MIICITRPNGWVKSGGLVMKMPKVSFLEWQKRFETEKACIETLIKAAVFQQATLPSRACWMSLRLSASPSPTIRLLAAIVTLFLLPIGCPLCCGGYSLVGIARYERYLMLSLICCFWHCDRVGICCKRRFFSVSSVGHNHTSREVCWNCHYPILSSLLKTRKYPCIWWVIVYIFYNKIKYINALACIESEIVASGKSMSG